LNRLATLPVNELFPAIVNEVCRFSAREHFDDDVCMVAVERKGTNGASEEAASERERPERTPVPANQG
jgi:hypothetical protein